MIYETEIFENGALHYQVQVRRRLDGSIQQRHIWHQTQSGRQEPPIVGPWIFSAIRSFERATERMKPSQDYLDEMGVALAALEAIAKGHNDPRQRAAAALEAIRNQAP